MTYKKAEKRRKIQKTESQSNVNKKTKIQKDLRAEIQGIERQKDSETY